MTYMLAGRTPLCSLRARCGNVMDIMEVSQDMCTQVQEVDITLPLFPGTKLAMRVLTLASLTKRLSTIIQNTAGVLVEGGGPGGAPASTLPAMPDRDVVVAKKAGFRAAVVAVSAALGAVVLSPMPWHVSDEKNVAEAVQAQGPHCCCFQTRCYRCCCRSQPPPPLPALPP